MDCRQPIYIFPGNYWSELAIEPECIDDVAAAVNEPGGQRAAVDRDFFIAIALVGCDDIGLVGIWGVQGNSTRADRKLGDTVHHGPCLVVVVTSQYQGYVVLLEERLVDVLDGFVVMASSG